MGWRDRQEVSKPICLFEEDKEPRGQGIAEYRSIYQGLHEGRWLPNYLRGHQLFGISVSGTKKLSPRESHYVLVAKCRSVRGRHL